MTQEDLIDISYRYPIIFFDGMCHFCNSFVQFIIRHDKNKVFKFCSLQAPIAQNFDFGSKTPCTNSTVVALYIGNTYYYSEVGLLIFKKLGGFWSILLVFRLVPKKIRDFFYLKFAQNRYKWFGLRSDCMVPDPSIREWFIYPEDHKI